MVSLVRYFEQSVLCDIHCSFPMLALQSLEDHSCPFFPKIMHKQVEDIFYIAPIVYTLRSAWYLGSIQNTQTFAHGIFQGKRKWGYAHAHWHAVSAWKWHLAELCTNHLPVFIRASGVVCSNQSQPGVCKRDQNTSRSRRVYFPVHFTFYTTSTVQNAKWTVKCVFAMQLQCLPVVDAFRLWSWDRRYRGKCAFDDHNSWK